MLFGQGLEDQRGQRRGRATVERDFLFAVLKLQARRLNRGRGELHQCVEQTIDADMLIRDGMERMIGSSVPIGVTENGKVIGQVSKDDLLTGLSDPSALN